MSNPVFRYLIADYLNVGTGETAEYKLLQTFETVDENLNPLTVEKHYTANKTATTIHTGYQPSFAVTGDRYQDDGVAEYLANIGEEQQVGVVTDMVRVSLFKPVGEGGTTYYARHFKVAPSVETLGGAGGEISNITATLNTIGEVEVGTFDITSATFTESE